MPCNPILLTLAGFKKKHEMKLHNGERAKQDSCAFATGVWIEWPTRRYFTLRLRGLSDACISYRYKINSTRAWNVVCFDYMLGFDRAVTAKGEAVEGASNDGHPACLATDWLVSNEIKKFASLTVHQRGKITL